MTTLRDVIRQLSNAHGFKLNTNLGQHFLADEAILEKIVDTAQITSEDTIVEIGAGLGILTKELVTRAKKVISIELDERWIPIAKHYANPDHKQNLAFIHGNALQVPLPTEPYKIVANIPYHITSPLLRHAFLESPVPPSSLTLLIQREVAEKIADPKDAGILTIMVALFGKARVIAKVPPEAFYPPPKVDSAVLHIETFPQRLCTLPELEKVLQLLKIGFSQKRKMMSNTLGALDDGKTKMLDAGIDPMRRPQTLSVTEWIELARRFL